MAMCRLKNHLKNQKQCKLYKSITFSKMMSNIGYIYIHLSIKLIHLGELSFSETLCISFEHLRAQFTKNENKILDWSLLMIRTVTIKKNDTNIVQNKIVNLSCTKIIQMGVILI